MPDMDTKEWLRLSLMNTYRAWAALVIGVSLLYNQRPITIVGRGRRYRSSEAKATLIRAWFEISPWMGDQFGASRHWLCQMLDLEWDTVRRLEWDARNKTDFVKRAVRAFEILSPHLTPDHALVAIGAGWCGPNRTSSAHWPEAERLLLAMREHLREARQL